MRESDGERYGKRNISLIEKLHNALDEKKRFFLGKVKFQTKIEKNKNDHSERMNCEFQVFDVLIRS